MATFQGCSLESCRFPSKNICDTGEKVIRARFSCGYVPPLDKRGPVQIDSHHIIDALGDFRERIRGNRVKCVEQFLAHTETVLLQSRHERHHWNCSLGILVDVLAVDVEEHRMIAQSDFCQGLIHSHNKLKR